MEKKQGLTSLQLKKSKEKNKNVLSAGNLEQRDFQKGYGSAQGKNAIRNLLQEPII